MPLTLIVEDGSGLSNANAFISVANADAYHVIQGNSDWVDTQAQGTLYMPVQPLNAETITIGSKVYTFQTVLTNVDGNVAIGASLAATQGNLYAAVNLLGIPSVNYAASMTAHPTVTLSLFTSNAALVTAVTGGSAGNSIALSDTVVDASVRFDRATLGRTREGKDDKIRAIILGCRYMETTYKERWVERRTNQLQALSWPRAWISDQDQFPISSSEIPLVIGYANAEMGLRVIRGDDLIPDTETSDANINSESVRVGPISTSVSYSGTKSVKKRYKLVDDLLRPYLLPSGQLWRA